jgi:hypothetical protein
MSAGLLRIYSFGDLTVLLALIYYISTVSTPWQTEMITPRPTEFSTWAWWFTPTEIT